ncbi:MAG: hypothetical protein WKG07_03855 [Hymenobacter sp.]
MASWWASSGRRTGATSCCSKPPPPRSPSCWYWCTLTPTTRGTRPRPAPPGCASYTGATKWPRAHASALPPAHHRPHRRRRRPTPDAADDHTHREFVRQWLARHGYQPGVVFSSEAYGPGLAAHLGAAHVMVDEARRQVPVSGTELKLEFSVRKEELSVGNSSFLTLNP